MITEQKVRNLYDVICVYKRVNDGNSPTREELVKLTGFTKTALHEYLLILESRKLIIRHVDRNKAGKIIVVGATWYAPEGWRHPPKVKAVTLTPYVKPPGKPKFVEGAAYCECGRGIVEWKKKIKVPDERVFLLCRFCREQEEQLYGSAGFERFGSVEYLRSENA
jgi:hypothetical protein